MLSRVERTIREHQLLSPGEHVLCAVSGGPDSMALMHALWELRERWRLTLGVVTVDHGLRPAARAEGELVAARAADLGLPWHACAVDVRGARERAGRGASWQDVARQLRLAALLDLAQAIGAGTIALGHQADDQIETILFRILRGTGVRGLTGIPYRRDRFVRPLLDVDRRQVLSYLRRRSIPFVQDPSNADPRFARARLRQQVLPALRAENPRLGEALRALAADAARVLTAAAPADPRGEGDAAGATMALDGAALPRLNRRAAHVVERLRRESSGTRRVDVAGGRVEISYGRATWHPAVVAAAVAAAAGMVESSQGDRDPGLTQTIVAPGDYGWGNILRVAVREGPPVDGADTFDADLVARPLRLRPMRPGDRMRPRGGRGSRKLSDMLIDAKIARGLRAQLPVLTTVDDEILFVPGLRPSEVARPRASTRKWLSVRLGVFPAPSRAEPDRDDPETSV